MRSEIRAIAPKPGRRKFLFLAWDRGRTNEMPRWQWGSYLFLSASVLFLGAGTIQAVALDTLPRYALSIDLDVDHHVAHVRQLVTWTNCARRPAHALVFNAHSHYQIPGADVGFLAKMVEILRMS